MSQRAAMRASGMRARARIKCWHRPPVPIRPMLSFSLAPKTLTAGTPKAASPAAVAAEVFRNERRDSFGSVGMGEIPWLAGLRTPRSFEPLLEHLARRL